MRNYALGNGEFSVREEKKAAFEGRSVEEIDKSIKDMASNYELDACVWKDNCGKTSVEVEWESLDYRGEDVEAFLKKLAPDYEGSIYFTGEDSSSWRFVVKNGTVEVEGGEKPGIAGALQRVLDYLREKDELHDFLRWEDSWEKECDALEYVIRLVEKAEEKPEKKDGEDKQHILDLLLPALKATSNLADLASLTYEEKKESVKATFDNGYSKTANVAADSGTAMIRDVIKQIV